MNTTLSYRLQLVKSHFQLSTRKLAHMAGISGQGMADIINGISKNPRNHIFTALSAKLGVDINWLLTGEGEMLKRSATQQWQDPAADYGAFVWLPFYKMGVWAAAEVAAFCNETETPERYPMQASVAKIYKQPKIMQLRGNNMEPDLRDGDVVLITKVEASDWATMNSGVYVIAYKPDHLTATRVIDNTMVETGKLILHSDNPKYGKVTIPTDHMLCIWQIRRILDRNL